MNQFLKSAHICLATSLITYHAFSQNKIKFEPEMTEVWEPQVPVVTTAKSTGIIFKAPSDAIILFDGKNQEQWISNKGESAGWVVKDGRLIVNKGSGDIATVKEFQDFQLHIEWMIPKNITGNGQLRGNSGIFLQGRYELQVLDSYENKTYSNGQAGSIYKQAAPLKNATNPPGEWNIYEIIYTSPRFNENGSLFSPARVTLLHNGILIQNNCEIRGNTEYIGLPKYTNHGKGPIVLQDHGDASEPISFRNIWIREL